MSGVQTGGRRQTEHEGKPMPAASGAETPQSLFVFYECFCSRGGLWGAFAENDPPPVQERGDSSWQYPTCGKKEKRSAAGCELRLPGGKDRTCKLEREGSNEIPSGVWL